MTTALWLYKVTRPVQFIAAAFGTWVIAVLSNGSDPFSANKLAAACIMGLGTLGGSVFHYGAAHRVYARKYWDLVETERPLLLVLFGCVSFAGCIAIAFRFLPWQCQALTIFNVAALPLYARVFSRWWGTKTLIAAFICTSPVLLGWWSGNHEHRIVPYAIVIIFCAYSAREIKKDIDDIRANSGIRVTLPMRLGITGAMRVAALFMTVSVVGVIMLFRLLPHSPLIMTLAIAGLCQYCVVAHRFFVKQQPGNAHTLITSGTYSLMAAVVLLALPF